MLQALPPRLQFRQFSLDELAHFVVELILQHRLGLVDVLGDLFPLAVHLHRLRQLRLFLSVRSELFRIGRDIRPTEQLAQVFVPLFHARQPIEHRRTSLPIPSCSPLEDAAGRNAHEQKKPKQAHPPPIAAGEPTMA